MKKCVFFAGGRNGHLGGQSEVCLSHLLRAESHSSGKGTSIPKIVKIRSQCQIVKAPSSNFTLFSHLSNENNSENTESKGNYTVPEYLFFWF